MDHQIASTIEQIVSSLTGHSVGPISEKIPLTQLTSEGELHLRQWLEALGVPSIRAQGMRPEGLINSYAAGRAWVQTNLTGEVSQRRTAPRASKGGMDLSGFGETEVRGVPLGELLGRDRSIPVPESEEEFSKAQGESGPSSDQAVPQADLDRIADRLVGSLQRAAAPKLEAIKKDLTEYNELQARQLSNRIDGKVRDAVATACREFAISETTQARISDLGRKAALAASGGR